nr:hypothetical protein GZ27B6_42 [uncultured archaeon GZfos27B6]
MSQIEGGYTLYAIKLLFGTSQIAYWILPLHDEVGEKQSEEEAEKRKRKRKGKACYIASQSFSQREATK